MGQERKFIYEHVREGVASGLRNFFSDIGHTVQRAFAQGAAEVAQGLFTGNAYVPYGPTQEPIGNGVHGPEITPPTPEERAKDAVDMQEAKQKETLGRAINNEIGKMTPEQQDMAVKFIEPPQQEEQDATKAFWQQRLMEERSQEPTIER